MQELSSRLCSTYQIVEHKHLKSECLRTLPKRAAYTSTESWPGTIPLLHRSREATDDKIITLQRQGCRFQDQKFIVLRIYVYT